MGGGGGGMSGSEVGKRMRGEFIGSGRGRGNWGGGGN